MTYNLDYTMQLRYVRATARYSFTLYRVPLALRSHWRRQRNAMQQILSGYL